MGLNLETLIGILVILILLILADGVRRMIRERHGRLRMRIDRRFRDQDGADGEDDDYLNELVGRPRVRSHSDDPLDEAHDDEPASRPGGEQQSLFDSDDEDLETQAGADDLESGERPSSRAGSERAAGKGAGKADRKSADRKSTDRKSIGRKSAGQKTADEPQPVLDVIVFHLIARRPERFDGKDMLRLMLESGLRYGDMNIFHRHRETRGEEELQFSVANAVKPGTFDIDNMEEDAFAGITFFMKLPGPGDALGALDRMLAIGRRMAEELDGELKDEQHSVLTPQTMEHLRQRVQEFERRQRVSNGA